MATVLLTHGQLRKTLSAVRSLGKKGIRTVVGDTTRWNPSAFSSFCSVSCVYPDPSERPEAFIQWLVEAISEYKVDVLFPMDENVMVLVLQHRELLETLCKLPIPPAASYRVAADKGLAVRLAEEAGAKVPRTVFPPQGASAQELKQLASELGYPLVVKPRHSSGSRGIRVVSDAAKLLDEYREVDRDYPRPILQEYIPTGPRFDVCLLYNATGEARAEFVQKELRHYPLERGPSTLQESARYPELLEQSNAIMGKLAWQGIAELEYMIDPRDGRATFMEINPRFWNSLELAVRCGIDFPWLLYQLAAEGDVPKVTEYDAGVRCKSLLPGDALHFLANPQRFRMNPPVWAGKRHIVHDDMMDWRDPGPIFGFLAACLRYSLHPKAWKMLIRR